MNPAIEFEPEPFQAITALCPGPRAWVRMTIAAVYSVSHKFGQYLTMVNLKHLYYFYNFSKELSTSKTALRLGITSPALSNQLKELEKFVGAPLTQRIKGKVITTEYGKILLHYAERMFTVYEDLNAKIDTLNDLTKGQLRVGVSHNLGARFALDLLSLLERSDVVDSKRLQIIFDSSENILALFTKGLFDVIFGDFHPTGGTHPGCISQRVYFPIRLFVSRGLLKKTQAGDKLTTLRDPNEIIDFANFNKIALVLPSQSVLRDETDRFLAPLTAPPERTIECNCPSAIVQVIERGYAMGFVSAPSLLDFKTAEELVVIGPTQGYWQHGVSILFQIQHRASLKKDSNLTEIFAPDSNYKFS